MVPPSRERRERLQGHHHARAHQTVAKVVHVLLRTHLTHQPVGPAQVHGPPWKATSPPARPPDRHDGPLERGNGGGEAGHEGIRVEVLETALGESERSAARGLEALRTGTWGDQRMDDIPVGMFARMTQNDRLLYYVRGRNSDRAGAGI